MTLNETLWRGAGFPPRAPDGCVVIGEVGLAHDGSVGLAHAFIDAVAAAGADAVKFQTHLAAAESTPHEPWRVRFSPQDDTRFDYWHRTSFTEEQWRGLKQHATDRRLLFISSPFSLEAARLLERLDVAAWKIASGELANLEWLPAVLDGRRPVLVSSGLSTLAEVDRVVASIEAAGNPVAVMQCTSAYPCPAERVGLNMLTLYRERYGCPVGLSDHSGTIYPALAAAVLDADVVEVHVTLSREMFGPDVSASVTTTEFRQLIEGVRFIEAMRTHPVDKDALGAELAPLRSIFTKSVVASRDLHRGTVLAADDLAIRKPGTGIPGRQLGHVVGSRLRRDLRALDVLRDEDLEVAE